MGVAGSRSNSPRQGHGSRERRRQRHSQTVDLVRLQAHRPPRGRSARQRPAQSAFGTPRDTATCIVIVSAVRLGVTYTALGSAPSPTPHPTGITAIEPFIGCRYCDDLAASVTAEIVCDDFARAAEAA